MDHLLRCQSHKDLACDLLLECTLFQSSETHSPLGYILQVVPLYLWTGKHKAKFTLPLSPLGFALS